MTVLKSRSYTRPDLIRAYPAARAFLAPQRSRFPKPMPAPDRAAVIERRVARKGQR